MPTPPDEDIPEPEDAEPRRGLSDRLPWAASRRRSQARDHDRLAKRVASEMSRPQLHAGPSNLRPAQVPWAVDTAAAWSWRLLVILAATYLLVNALWFLRVVTLPVVVALFAAALAAPIVNLLVRFHVRRKVAALLTVLFGVAAISLLLVFVGQQVASGAKDLSDQVVGGLEEIRVWLRTGPLHATDSQINDFLGNVQSTITDQNDQLVSRATEVTTAVGHIVAGLFIVLFATYFFLADGDQIWAWVVRIFPRAARLRADSSGRVAWVSLTQFVRATVLVALTDALGVMLVAGVLKVPLVIAIGVLVFIGAFIPMVGALLSGSVAVLVALVAQGPLVALFMLIGVVVVQQIEAHVLQPFLMGRFVSVHPLGVIIAIGCGVIVGGIQGALVAVPLVAVVNAVVQHLASFTRVGEDPEEAGERDPLGAPS